MKDEIANPILEMVLPSLLYLKMVVVLRETRNEIAHTGRNDVDWKKLADDFEIVDAELRHLNLVGQRRQFEVVGGRDREDSMEPGIMYLMKYHVHAKADDTVFASINWTKKFFRFGWDERRVKDALARGEKPPSGLGD